MLSSNGAQITASMERIFLASRSLQATIFRRFTRKPIILKKSPHDYPVVTGSELWKSKVHTFFRAHDLDGDGYLSQNDFEMSANRIADYLSLDGIKAKELKKNRLELWEAIVKNRNNSDEFKVSEEAYLSSFLAAVNSNFRESLVDSISFDFDCMDIDGDGFISPKEHEAVFFGWGIPIKHSSGVFKVLDADGDGFISKEEFIEGAVDFTFSEDENSPYNCFFGPLVK